MPPNKDSIESICHEYNTGRTLTELARKHKTHWLKIRKVLNENEIPIRSAGEGVGLDSAEERILDYHERGVTTQRIAANLRMPIAQVREFLESRGLAAIEDIIHKRANLNQEIMARLAAGDRPGEIVGILRLKSINLVWDAIRESDE